MAGARELLSYLRLLTSPYTNTGKKRQFDDVLLLKIDSLKAVLNQDGQLPELQLLLRNLPDHHDIRWTFVNTCLQLIARLKQSLIALKEEKGGSKESENLQKNAPPLPADALSVGDQNTVLRTIQFVVTLGICPNLLPGVGIPIERRSGFASVLNSSHTVKNERRLFDCLDTLVDCVQQQPSLGSLILSRHLGDILSGLLQLCYAPLSAYADCNKINQSNSKDAANEKTEKVLNPSELYTCAKEQARCSQSKDQRLFITTSERERCMCNLQRLLDRIYQPIAIKELLILQAVSGNCLQNESSTRSHVKAQMLLACTPKWLKEICGVLLSERLMRPHGVKAVLHAVLDGPGGKSNSSDWKKRDAIAKLIAQCPSQASSVEEYYQQVSVQVLSLLHGRSTGVGKLLARAAACTIREMLSQYPELTHKYVLSSITGPLEKTTKDEECIGIFLDESTILQCVEDIQKVFIFESHQAALVYILPVIHPIFELFCFSRKGVSHLRSSLKEILVNVIEGFETQHAVRMLYSLVFKQPNPPSFDADNPTTSLKCDREDTETDDLSIKFMSDNLVFAHGDGGGLTVSYQCNNQSVDSAGCNDTLMENLHKFHVSSTFEDNAHCIVELLADMKDKKSVAGHLFIQLMQELSSIILKISQETLSGDSVSNQHSLIVFNLVAVMCDKLGPTILTSTPEILSFIKSTLQRGCALINTDEEGLGVVFITETLIMALGMLSVILGGEVEVKIEQNHQPLLTDLLPLLETLATRHPTTEVQQIAGDSRCAIATHCAVWSDKLKEAAENIGSKTSARECGGIRGYDKLAEVESKGTKNEQRPASQVSEFDEAFADLCDALLPVRGHAILKLASLLRHRHPEAMEKADILLEIFLQQLKHHDSYIYLAAIQGLVSLADVRVDKVVPQLASEFAMCTRKASEPSAEEKVAKQQGHSIPSEEGGGCPSLLTTYVTSPKEHAVSRSPELRMKLGEALVKTTRICGDLLPRFTQHILPALLTGVKDPEPLVRASSLSNLGDVCQLLKFSMGPVINEVFNCVAAALKTDESAEVRRSAVLVITLMLRGLGKNTMQVLDSLLKELYQLLKTVASTDLDDVTRVHALVALGELDTITRDYLFPKPSFTKRIRVLP